MIGFALPAAGGRVKGWGGPRAGAARDPPPCPRAHPPRQRPRRGPLRGGSLGGFGSRTTRRQITPPTKNGHAPPPTKSRKSSQSVNPHCVWTWRVAPRTPNAGAGAGVTRWSAPPLSGARPRRAARAPKSVALQRPLAAVRLPPPGSPGHSIHPAPGRGLGAQRGGLGTHPSLPHIVAAASGERGYPLSFSYTRHARQMARHPRKPIRRAAGGPLTPPYHPSGCLPAYTFGGAFGEDVDDPLLASRERGRNLQARSEDHTADIQKTW
ncbi:hypothetical protein LSTR_LSTR016345 [Laodelphax striatellus]|uniref:Uncharacterized protein n=1 Tax=Laodelphax striatellus TaxID=195883 RepID=A0A482WZU4_LAOST|nr:hypothetical protein LSTR_LSTR016345 [Laodelphax striatellus]